MTWKPQTRYVVVQAMVLEKHGIANWQPAVVVAALDWESCCYSSDSEHETGFDEQIGSDQKVLPVMELCLISLGYHFDHSGNPPGSRHGVQLGVHDHFEFLVAYQPPTKNSASCPLLAFLQT